MDKLPIRSFVLLMHIFLSFGDRPEIKEDVDAVVTSLVNTSAGDYAEWFTCGSKFTYQAAYNWKAHLSDAQSATTYHGLRMLTGLESAPEKTEVAHCKSKVLNIVHETQSDTSQDAVSIVSHAKYLVPSHENRVGFKETNIAMLDQVGRCYQTRKFIRGILLADDNAESFFHVYSEYSADGACTDAAATNIIYQKWVAERSHWLLLPNQINQMSPQMRSREHADHQGSLSSPTSLAKAVGKWIACTGEFFPEHGTDAIIQHFMDDKPAESEAEITTDNEVYGETRANKIKTMRGNTPASFYIFQLFENAAAANVDKFETPTGNADGQSYKAQCRYQILHELIWSPAEKPLKPVDRNDRIIHTEYEIRSPVERKKFIAATAALMAHNIDFHKQVFLFSGGFYNDNEYFHLYQVFESTKDMVAHGTSNPWGAWKTIRDAGDDEWVKMVDGLAHDALDLIPQQD